MVNPRGSHHDRPAPSLGGGDAPSLRSAHSEGVEIYTPHSHVESAALVHDRELSELMSRVQSLSISDTDKLVRPEFGSRGAQTKLRANLFQMRYPNDIVLYDYTIKIQPDIRKGEDEFGDLRKHIVGLFGKSKELGPFLQGIALDGARRLIAKAPMPENFAVKVATRVQDEKEAHAKERFYYVTLHGPKKLTSADLARFLRGSDPKYNPAPILSAFNLIISSHAERTGFRASGKHAYYFNPNEDLGIRTRPGIAVVNGYFATVRPGFKSLMVNVNACMSAFYVPTERLSDAMLSYFRQSKGAMHPQKFFGKMRVTTTYLGYSKRSSIKGFGVASARKTTIWVDGSEKTTVEKYFQKKYGVTLEHADDMPVVNIGVGDKDVYVPAELCKIEPGSLFTGELNRRESAALCRANNRTPAGDARMITTKGMHLLGLETSTAPLTSFGIKVSLDMAVVSARVLPAPKVVCKSGQLPIVDGSWTTRGIRFEKPAKLARLAVLVIQDTASPEYLPNPEAELRGPIGALLSKCRECGMDVDQSFVVRLVNLPRMDDDDGHRSNAVTAIRNVVDSFPARPEVVLALVPDKDQKVFAGLRNLFDTRFGIQSLVALIPNIRDKDGQDQYLTQLVMKLNVKLGGINHRLDSGSLKWLQNTMVVGMDVTRPGEGSAKGTPTIAAVAASCDMNFVHYPASVGMVDAKAQSIPYVGQMMIERLKEYKSRMKTFPERMVIFRAGAGDSIAQQVMKDEIENIKKAFSELRSYKPKITYVTCGKSHRARFYPTRAEDAGKTSNPKAGTVIDQGVTGIYDFDFYLQVHGGSQGTVRATRYTVLRDDNKFGPDVLQQGINDLSYLWAPASGSVSLVPAAYCADRACKRGMLYLHRLVRPAEGSTESKLSADEVKNRASALWGNGVHDDLKSTMYFV